MTTRKRIVLGALCLAGLVAGAAWLWLVWRGFSYTEKFTRTAMTLRNVAMASRTYFKMCGAWPTTVTQLTTTNNPAGVLFLYSPRSEVMDGWGHPLEYIPFDPRTGAGAVRSHLPKKRGEGSIMEETFP
jgi:hypothetical protein